MEFSAAVFFMQQENATDEKHVQVIQLYKLHLYDECHSRLHIMNILHGYFFLHQL